MHHSAACGHRGRVCPKALDKVQLLGLDRGERPVRRSLQALQAGEQAEVGRVAFMVAPSRQAADGAGPRAVGMGATQCRWRYVLVHCGAARARLVWACL